MTSCPLSTLPALLSVSRSLEGLVFRGPSWISVLLLWDYWWVLIDGHFSKIRHLCKTNVLVYFRILGLDTVFVKCSHFVRKSLCCFWFHSPLWPPLQFQWHISDFLYQNHDKISSSSTEECGEIRKQEIISGPIVALRQDLLWDISFDTLWISLFQVRDVKCLPVLCACLRAWGGC